MKLNVENGLAMSRADDIVCDEQNIIWIKSSRGLQYWDGQSIHTFEDSLLEVGTEFYIYPHSQEGIIVSMAGLARQFTFGGLKNKIIYESSNVQNDFIPIYLPSSKKSNVLLVHPDSIFHVDTDNIQHPIFTEKKVPNNISNAGQYSIDGTNFLVDFNSHRSFENKTDLIDDIIASLFASRIRNAVLLDGDKCIYTSKQDLNIIDHNSDVSWSYPNFMKARYYSSILKISDTKLLIGIDNTLCEFDLESNNWTHIYKNIDQNNLLQTGYFDKLIFDKHKNIWAITVNEGLLKIYNNESFNYYGSNDKKLNFVKNLVVDESDNRIIYAALNGGILVFDTLGNQTHHLSSQNTEGLINSVTGIYRIGQNQYIYNNHKDSMIYGLTFKNDKANVSALEPKKETYLYYQDALQIDNNTSLLLFNTLYKLQHEPFKLTPLFLFNSTKSCMMRDGDEIWIGCIDGILKYKIGDGNNYNFISLPGEGYVRSISKWKEGSLALGTDRGLSVFNKEDAKLTFVDEGCIYCLLSDEEHNIWAGTGEGLLKYDQEFNKTHYSKIDGLQNNEFNTNACVKNESGKMYFGGLNGITSFDPDLATKKDQDATIYIKSLFEGNDNLVTNTEAGIVNNINLNHDHNNLIISVGAIGKFESSNYNYQYYVDGISSKWIDTKDQTTYNFNLSPGKYKFYFSASNAFNPNVKLQNPLIITIKGPWWKQWWFYLAALLSIIGIITYFIRANEKQKYLKKKFEWELEYRRQEDRMEMSKELHDNIGSRLTFLVSSIENIKKAFQSNSSKAMERIDHLTDFGKDTIEDLRSMMWVLNQQTITVQDLQLKVLDYLNIAKHTYKNIDFQYEGPTSGMDQKLDSKLSQNIFRVIQEGIHNSVRHADPSVVSIRIEFENQTLHITIEDDGSGFDLKNGKKGNGLSNMKSRLSEHHSELVISSDIDKGTTLQFKINTSTK